MFVVLDIGYRTIIELDIGYRTSIEFDMYDTDLKKQKTPRYDHDVLID